MLAVGKVLIGASLIIAFYVLGLIFWADLSNWFYGTTAIQ